MFSAVRRLSDETTCFTISCRFFGDSADSSLSDQTEELALPPCEPGDKLTAKILQDIRGKLFSFHDSVLIHEHRRSATGKPLSGDLQSASDAGDTGVDAILLQHTP